jgi:hypothetical protein
MALLQRNLLGGTHVGQRQHHIGRLALEADAAHHGAGHASEHAAQDATDILAAGVGVLVDDVGHQHVVGRLHLALADVRAAAQLTAAGQRALGLRRRQALATVHQREAARLRHEHLDQRLGRFQVQRRPPLVLGLRDRHRAHLLLALGDFRGRLLVGGDGGAGKAGAQRGQHGGGNQRSDGRLSHDGNSLWNLLFAETEQAERMGPEMALPRYG